MYLYLYPTLRDNLRDGEPLSTMDKRPIPTMSIVWRFHCITIKAPSVGNAKTFEMLPAISMHYWCILQNMFVSTYTLQVKYTTSKMKKKTHTEIDMKCKFHILLAEVDHNSPNSRRRGGTCAGTSKQGTISGLYGTSGYQEGPEEWVGRE